VIEMFFDRIVEVIELLRGNRFWAADMRSERDVECSSLWEKVMFCGKIFFWILIFVVFVIELLLD